MRAMLPAIFQAYQNLACGPIVIDKQGPKKHTVHKFNI